MSIRKTKVRKGDLVTVTVGKNKGAVGEIVNIDRTAAQVVVGGVNMVTRHMRPTPQNPEGKKTQEKSIHISNVALVDPETKKSSRAGYRLEKGKKIRYLKKSGKEV